MAQTIKVRRTGVASRLWNFASITSGEFALNTLDERLWLCTVDNTTALEILNDSTSFGGDVSGTYDNLVIANDSHTHSNYQPLDTDLTNIASLTGTSGFLKTDGSNTWTVDASTYLTSLPSLSSTVSGIVTANGSVDATKFLTTDGTWAVPGGSNTPEVTPLTATSGQTVFTADYNTSNVAVYAGGIRLDPTEYTATNGTSVTTNESIDLNTVVQIVSDSGSAGSINIVTDATPQLGGDLDPNGKAIIGTIEKAISQTGTAIDVSSGNVFYKTISGATTLTVSNVPSSGYVASFILELTNPSTNVTFWAGVKWEGGNTPTLTTTGLDILGFYTRDGGTTWRGAVMVLDSK